MLGERLLPVDTGDPYRRQFLRIYIAKREMLALCKTAMDGLPGEGKSEFFNKYCEEHPFLSGKNIKVKETQEMEEAFNKYVK